MSQKASLLVILWCFAISYIKVECKSIIASQSKPIVMVVSYDAFGNYYFDLETLKHMQEFREEGVYAPYMNNVFPTKTFTNHFSIATGLYPEEHGVLENSLYDTESGNITYGYELFHYKKDVLPIWTLNEMNGGVSGCMMWPGSDFEYSGINCTYTYSFNTSVPLKERVDIVMRWLTDLEKPANLIMFYSEEPDQTGHRYGPLSSQTISKVEEVNFITKYIQVRLRELALLEKANVIHLSDHGMVGVSSDHFIDLRKYLENGTYSMYGTSPVLQIVPVKGKESEIYQRLKEAAKNVGQLEVFNTSELYNRWHCKNPRRFGPIITVANLSYALNDMYEMAEYYWKKFNIPFTPQSVYGVHGYDNELSPMKAFFMAKGPLFKKSHVTAPFNNVDLFNLLCQVLHIESPPKTNGKFDVIKDILHDSSVPADTFHWWHAIVVVSLVLLLVSWLVCLFRHSTRFSYAENRPLWARRLSDSSSD